MTREEAQAFAGEWAAAWNTRDVERVLAHFDDDVTFTSPTALAVVGVATLRGKQALRDYWNKAVARIGSLRGVPRRRCEPVLTRRESPRTCDPSRRFVLVLVRHDSSRRSSPIVRP